LGGGEEGVVPLETIRGILGEGKRGGKARSEATIGVR